MVGQISGGSQTAGRLEVCRFWQVQDTSAYEVFSAVPVLRFSGGRHQLKRDSSVPNRSLE